MNRTQQIMLAVLLLIFPMWKPCRAQLMAPNQASGFSASGFGSSTSEPAFPRFQSELFPTVSPRHSVPLTVRERKKVAPLGTGPRPAYPEGDGLEPEEQALISQYTDPFRVLRDGGRVNALEFSLRQMREAETPLGAQLPVQMSGTRHYREAFQELTALLQDSVEKGLKRAVFLVENAWMDQQMNYADFCADLDRMVGDCRYLLAQAGRDDNWTRNLVIRDYLTDTTVVRRDGQLFTQLPIGYDFDDYLGHTDWSKQFVTKLVRTWKGQCHSLPLLYLILANELDAEAYLAFAPNHIYIKFPDQWGKLRNVELTNGQLTTDAWMLGSGYVKAEAIRYGIYLDTISLRQAQALCLIDLAKGYAIRFGLDRFVLEAVNAGLEVHPTNIYGLLLKSDFYTQWFAHAHARAGYPDLAVLKAKHSELFQLLQQRDQLYALIDSTGYEQIPDRVYRKWLSDLQSAAQKQSSPSTTSEFHNN